MQLFQLVGAPQQKCPVFRSIRLRTEEVRHDRWDPDAMPAGWEATRSRYFARNWIRAAATWTAFALFLAALLAL